MRFLHVLLGVVFLYLSWLASAFNADYSSVDSTVRSIGDYNIRDIFNAPYSYCKTDNIPDKYCGKVSLLLGGKVFKSIYYDAALANSMQYGHALDSPSLNVLLSKYFLPSYQFKPWKVPTEGQLSFMFNNNIIDFSSNETFWIKDENSNSLRTVTTERNTTTQNKAKIYRFVTDDMPKDCNEGDCDLFIDDRSWQVRFYSDGSITWGWSISWKDKHNNNSSSDSGRWNGTVFVPGNTYDVIIGMWVFGQSTTHLYNVNKLKGDKRLVCVHVTRNPPIRIQIRDC